MQYSYKCNKVLIFILAGCSKGGCNDFTNEDLFNFLRGRGLLNPQSLDTRSFLFDIIKNKYSGHKWEETYEKSVKHEILKFSLALTKKWAQSNRTFNIFT